jgi:FtsP/CotA-like multicopper oxidase with cupredoxin domain
MITYDQARRRFMRQSLLGTAIAAFPGLLPAIGEQIKSSATTNFKPDVEFEFSAHSAQISILADGPPTAVQKFSATVLNGPQNVLQQLPANYLGPILKLRQGQKVRVFFRNNLTQPTIIHWHGLHVPQSSDGHPMYTIQPGEQYVYEFEVRNRAGTSFYHSHAHELTAEQVYHGLAGMIVVSDEIEDKLNLPRDEFDLPLVIQDRSFNAQKQLYYLHMPPERVMGFLGDTILVNGKPNAEFKVKSRAYRFRAVNGSNSRMYKLGWEDGTPLVAIGTDAGLLEKPETRPYIMLAPGERVDLWLDFSGRPVGSKLRMFSLPYSGVMPAMYEHMFQRQGGGMMGMMPHKLPQGGKFPIAEFVIIEKVSDSPILPAKLVSMRRFTEADVDNASQPLPIAISMQRMTPMLNGKTFVMDRVLDYEKVDLGSHKKIRISHQHSGMGMGMRGMRHRQENETDHSGMGGIGGGMMMDMAHPIHLHGQQFQIIKRNTSGVHAIAYETVKHGFIDSGWKDTVLVMPGETVDIIKPFQDYKGLFLYHCHNLEHEDLGMMRQFLVE